MCPFVRVWRPHQQFVTNERHFQYPGVAQWGVGAHHTHFWGTKTLYGRIGGSVVDFPWEDMARSGSVQLGQGTAVLEVAGSVPVKVFLVPVEAHQGKEFLEDLVLYTLPQEPVVPCALDHHPVLGDMGSHGHDPHRHCHQCHQEYFLVDQLVV